MIDDLRAIVGAPHVLTGSDMARWSTDWTGHYTWTPLTVVRPGSTDEVSQILALANKHGTPVVPLSGGTGVVGGGMAEGMLVLSLDRMNRIRGLNPASRTMTVEAGVILSTLHDRAEAVGLQFPLTFGARGSAMVGGFLSTNAGGSNVVRYGNARDLCLGLEVVLADGRVMDLMTALHKNNSGLDLRHLMIGAEGTLGVITAAVLKLVPRPAAFATALLTLDDLGQALSLMHRLQAETGGAVEAIEYMPPTHMQGYYRLHPELAPVLDPDAPVTLLVEVGARSPADAAAGPDGTIPVVAHLEEVLADLLANGQLRDALVARSEAQRRSFWALREAAAEILFAPSLKVDTDIAVALDDIPRFYEMVRSRIAALDPGAHDSSVAHLGDGNIHYVIYPSRDDPALLADLRDLVDEVVASLRGSFSAEHGVGVLKRESLRRHKDPVALEAMRAIKAALDPKGILNPGKVYAD